MYEPVTAVKGGNPVMEGVMRMPSNTTGREVYRFSLCAIIDAFNVLYMRSQILLLEGVQAHVWM